jgi:hypothetical protein
MAVVLVREPEVYQRLDTDFINRWHQWALRLARLWDKGLGAQDLILHQMGSRDATCTSQFPASCPPVQLPLGNPTDLLEHWLQDQAIPA